MRIFEAIKYHYKKNLLNYGLISAALTFIGAIFIPNIVRWIFEMVHSLHKGIIGAIIYLLLLTIIALPMCFAISWITEKR